jgi:HSP20 family protein
MTLVRWQPLRNVTTLQREMDRLFENSLGLHEPVAERAFAPAAELRADAENIYLNLEVPGVNPEDIDIEVTAQSVTIEGERKDETTTETAGAKRSEFRYGKFKRTFALAQKIDRDRVAAKYEGGVLQITLPKTEDDKYKAVKVAVAA